MVRFIGYKNDFNIGDIQFYQQIRTGLFNPTPEENSIVSGFSTIYTQTIKTGIKWNNLSFEFAIPDQIIAGNAFLNIPIGRGIDGPMIYDNATINLTTKPSTEYTLKYDNLSATYINNPDWKDEIFFTAKVKTVF